MRQGLALVRGALLATALFVVPASGPAVAHALSLPVHVQVGLGNDVNVSVDGPDSTAAVSVGGATVTVPNVGSSAEPPPSGPIPQPPALPDPVAGPVQDVTNTGNGVVGGVTGQGDSGSSPSTGSGGTNDNSGNNGGGSGSGGSGGGGGGNGSPNANAGGRTPGATGRRPGASTPTARARARR